MDMAIPIPDFYSQSSDTCPLVRAHSAETLRSESPFPEISPQALRTLLLDPSSAGFDTVLVIDARFEYEHKGGKISNAINVRSAAQMELVYTEFADCNIALVFHCEFSQNRGPTLMRAFREYDRIANFGRYPHLTYPHVFLLSGGYNRFYTELPEMCVGGYVPMRAPDFVESGELLRSHSSYKIDIIMDSRKARRIRSSSEATLPSPWLVFGCSNSHSQPLEQVRSPSLT
jgi:hypothetical protein